MTEELIRAAQSGSDAHTLALIKKFDPLLHKLSYELGYEDAYYDLLLDYLKLILSINLDSFHNLSEASLVSYLIKSIRNSFIRLNIKAKKNTIKTVPFSDLSDQQKYYTESKQVIHNDFSDFYFEQLKSYISEKEWEIIELVYIKGYTVSEIANQRNISRQAVNQIKKRALRKLKDAMQKTLWIL